MRPHGYTSKLRSPSPLPGQLRGHSFGLRSSKYHAIAQFAAADVAVRPRAHPRRAPAAEDAVAFRHFRPVRGTKRVGFVPRLTSGVHRERDWKHFVVFTGHAD